MSRARRIELIKKIEQARDSKVVTYITSDRPDLLGSMHQNAVYYLQKHLMLNGISSDTNIDLLLYSRGGDADAPWSIVSMLREYCGNAKFSVLIPYKAHSAATVISLGADEIVMTKNAELGPIDSTMGSGPYNPTHVTGQPLPISTEDVTGYFSLLDKVGCERPTEKMAGFQLLTEKVHPLALGKVNRLLEQTELVALRLLSTRSRSFPEQENKTIVKKLSSEIYSHRHAISRTEALQFLELKQVVKAEDQGIDTELWELYTEYESMFDMSNPFSPESYLLDNKLREHTWQKLPLACVESTEGLDIESVDVRLRSLLQPEPNITLNLQNYQLPPINVGNLPEGLSPEQFQSFVGQLIQNYTQAALNAAIGNAIEAIMDRMPTAGFERSDFNRKWITEGNDD